MVLTDYFQQQDLGTYTAIDVARGAGVVLAVVSIVCLVLAIGFSVPRMRQRRTAFWIPLACAGVWFVLTVALVIAAVVADPAFIVAMQRPA